ncbi:hypothetical protein [Nocardia brasiliensis]
MPHRAGNAEQHLKPWAAIGAPYASGGGRAAKIVRPPRQNATGIVEVRPPLPPRLSGDGDFRAISEQRRIPPLLARNIAEADDQYEQVVTDSDRVLGSGHPFTEVVRRTLAAAREKLQYLNRRI